MHHASTTFSASRRGRTIASSAISTPTTRTRTPVTIDSASGTRASRAGVIWPRERAGAPSRGHGHPLLSRHPPATSGGLARLGGDGAANPAWRASRRSGRGRGKSRVLLRWAGA